MTYEKPATQMAATREKAPVLGLSRAFASKSRFRLLLVACLLTAVGLDYFFFTGFYSSDDISYYEFARYWWLTGSYPTKLLLGGLRLPIIIWNWLMISLVGPNPNAVASTFVVFHLLLILACHGLARRLLDRPTALVAAYLTATAPPLIHYSTTIMPDTFVAICTVFSLYAFMRAYDNRDSQRRSPSAAWMLVCGISVGLGYMVKESGLILLPFYFVAWLFYSKGRRWTTAVWIGAMFPVGVALIFLVEYGIFYLLLDRSFIRLGFMTDGLDPETKAHILRYGISPIGRFNWVCERINEYYYFVSAPMKWGILAVLAAYPFVKKARLPILMIATWQFAFLTWGTMSFTEYFPPSIQARYYIPVLPFVILMFAFVIARLFPLIAKIRRRGVQTLLSGLAAGVIVLLPLRGLKVADRAAGKAYRAETIGNVTRALTHAASQNNGPVVISSYLRHRYKYVYQDRKTDWILNANAITEDRLLKMLDGGAFYYAETAWQPFEPRTPIDALLQSLVSDDLAMPPRAERLPVKATPPGADSGIDLAQAPADRVPIATFWSTSSELLGVIQFQGRTADVIDLGWFTPLVSRTAEIQCYLGHGILPERKLGLKPDRQSVRLVRVIPRRKKTIAISGAHDGEASSSEAGGANITATSTLEWKGSDQDWAILSSLRKHAMAEVSTVAPSARLENRNGMGPTVLLTLLRKEYEWLVPADRSNEGAIRLTEAASFEFSVKTHSSESVGAELRLDIFDPSDGTSPVIRKRIKLRPGVARFGIRTNAPGCRVVPAIKLTGSGEFSLDHFDITRVNVNL